MSSIESKRVQYRKYLERAGVIDALSKALIKLYEEQNKPDDAIRFVRKFMCESCPDDAQFDAMKADLEEANKTISKLEQDLERMRDQVKKTPEEIAELLEEGWKSLMEDEIMVDSLLRKYLTREVLDEHMANFTPPPVEASLLDCVQCGFDNHDARCGVYAADPDCYNIYNSLFDPILRDLHGLLDVEKEKETLQADSDFGNADEIENLDQERKYILSTTIALCRNLDGYPFFTKLREKQFTEIESKVMSATEALDGELAGAYFKMGDIAPEMQEEMVKRSILFKRGDPFLTSARCYRFWPIGRGVFHNPAETFMVWANAEDHLRIISMAKCGDLGDVYVRLIKGATELEKNLLFIRHASYGVITVDPSNMGTGMRASVRIRLPNLAKDLDKLRETAASLNLDVYGSAGEFSPIEDGIMDVIYHKRLGVTEFEIIKGLQDGVLTLIKAEQELEAAE